MCKRRCKHKREDKNIQEQIRVKASARVVWEITKKELQ